MPQNWKQEECTRKWALKEDRTKRTYTQENNDTARKNQNSNEKLTQYQGTVL
jgi:hypothetical protein